MGLLSKNQRVSKRTGRPLAYGKYNAVGIKYECERIWRREWGKANPEKRRAHVRVCRAIKAGLLTRMPCAICGNPDVHAHHPEGYDRWKIVQWLCPMHHREIHS